MAPVIERVPERVRHRLSPRHELVVRISFASAIGFTHAVGTHGTPLVVVAFKPDFEKVLELPVRRNVLWWQMAVIVEDRLVLGIAVVQPLGMFGLK